MQRRAIMVKYGKIYPVSFGFAWGLLAGIGWMLLAWMGARWGYGLPLIQLMSSVFFNYAATLVGGFWGLLWGFLDSFVFALLAVWVYNETCKCFCPAGSCDSSCD
ncbi:MAG: hypothetical protein A3I77_05405 [Gammaproteobacteria bacterium RIFCSPLOWO2_02_FULL_42_14]|nr:MAG: hypothetical protein A2624_01730 [Gammaproteobacteria bacterium RIFCSPHIGHO2_01_FULL_42_8]OGT51209.1 MAG: hypothetical protein A3E54_03160 [Gammaproteobacteria bacterium RIFCSPHIGHO2_12_FULL_41_25]OGT62970.1 MAG: hypothetical protein A3I77_05405 [Gammaproteobacteria bacterium RIFCSPLOWO2_02_FULL_42_14]OGT86103.1 MAG: hypothetical protein A3G86_02960 [Gammaproteobacteria bacterium RIFCSPLOWO2_12_FULL_42_18]